MKMAQGNVQTFTCNSATKVCWKQITIGLGLLFNISQNYLTVLVQWRDHPANTVTECAQKRVCLRIHADGLSFVSYPLGYT